MKKSGEVIYAHESHAVLFFCSAMRVSFYGTTATRRYQAVMREV